MTHDIRCLLDNPSHDGRCWVLDYEYHNAHRELVVVPVPGLWHKPGPPLWATQETDPE